MNMSRRDSYILIAIALVGIVAAYWFMALSPKRKEASQLDKDIVAAQQQLDQSKQEKVTFAQAQLDFPRMYASLGRMGKAVPPDDDVPSLLVQLNHAAAKANVDFRSVELKLDLAEKQATAGAEAAASAPPAGQATPPAGATGSQGATPPAGTTGGQGAAPAAGTATASATTSPAPATSGTVATSPAPVDFQKVPFEYKFEGGFYDIEKLIRNINELVDRRNQELAIAGRLITIEGFSLKRGKVTILATTYMLPADQGLFAGATPQGPANADPAAPQAASAGGTTPAPPTAAVTSP
jgi:uncharacterized membrane-anchored protein YhcB (DUF1043 family)